MSIITEKTEKFLKRSFKLGGKFGFHPYDWNDEKDRPELTASKKRRCLWYIHALLVFAYYGFLTWRCIEINTSETAKTSQKIYMQFVQALYAVPVLFQIVLLLRTEEFPHFINEYLRFTSYFEENFCRPDAEPGKLAKVCEYFIIGCSYAFSIDGIIFALASIFRPKSLELLSSLGDNPQVLSWATLASGLLQCYFIYGILTNILMLVFSGFSFVFPSLELIKEFGCRQSKLTRQKLQLPRNIFRMYCVTQIEVRQALEVFSILVIGAKLIISFFAIFCTYGAIRLHGLLAIALGLIGVSSTGFLAILVNTLAEFHSRSVQALRNLKTRTEDPDFSDKYGWRPTLYRKTLKALQPIRIDLASMYYIDKGLVLLLLRVISENTINFLLLHS